MALVGIGGRLRGADAGRALYADTALQLDLSLVMILSLLALSMGLLWGYVGILSFGQTIFFGLGGYAYALFSLNTDLPWWRSPWRPSCPCSSLCCWATS